MVYCGKPSASCGNCRSKKRRCDKAVPSCGQCRRTGQICQGYRDTSSLVFRNETKRIVDRARLGAISRSRVQPKSPKDVVSTLPPGMMSPNSTSELLTHTTVLPSLISEDSSPLSDGGQSLLLLDFEGPSSPDGDRGLFQQHPAICASSPDFLLPDPLKPLSEATPCTNIYSPMVSPENIHSLGINYFLANYVVIASGPSSGYLDYIMEALDRQNEDSPLVEAAVSAVGLAGFSNTTGTLSGEAWSYYSEALERLGRALSHPNEAKKDSILIVFILLGLFESIMCTAESSLATHIDDLSTLLAQRGIAQLKTNRGLHLFQETISHLFDNCSRIGRSIPSCVRLLCIEATRCIPANTPTWVLSTAQIEVMDLYHKIDLERTEPFLKKDWESLLLRAVEVDRDLEKAFTNISSAWKYKSVSDPQASPAVAYEEKFHIYHDVWINKKWNSMRSCRIMLNGAIRCLIRREAMTWAAHELTDGGVYIDLMGTALETIKRMRDDILASVPQMLGFVYHNPATGTSLIDCSSDKSPPLGHHAAALGAHFLMWPLYLIGTLSITTTETRAWIVNRLRTMRAMAGIRKAEYLAGLCSATVVT
ncbi:hypothetical protein PT974_09866 [Cladobotryum mycophilum]|uniref:Zn(2)-C6 fungal-type domain-containing protein n=1 Tax=Cladobotryum mycophilum TaxID=491253 RepID=A0ABR0SIQ8_9HYPO